MAAARHAYHPSVTSHSHSRSSRRSQSSVGNRTTQELIDRLNDEQRSRRHSNQAGALIISQRDQRSVGNINAEIAALEAESRAKNLERKAGQERELAYEIRDRPVKRDEYEVVEYRDRDRDRYYDRSRYRVQSLDRHRYRRDPYGEKEIVLFGRQPKDEVEVYEERRRSPERNVVRVEKDRKGRLSFVKSAR